MNFPARTFAGLAVLKREIQNTVGGENGSWSMHILRTKEKEQVRGLLGDGATEGHEIQQISAEGGTVE